MLYAVTGDTHNIEPAFWEKLRQLRPDVIFHVGDWTMQSQELRVALMTMRDVLPRTPCYAVLGNHDWWSDKTESDHRLATHWRRTLMNQYHVTWLRGTTVTVEGLKVGGFDGWYEELLPPTNDRKFVNPYLWDRLVELAKVQAGQLAAEQPDIVLTHFPVSTGYAKVLAEFCHLLCIGHWHYSIDADWFGMRTINPGSDYGVPQFKLIEL
jgi:predicted MPP superfamily phosphohydrolase